MPRKIHLHGVPLQDGTYRKGCEMGPSALRTAQLAETLVSLGHSVTDKGNIAPGPLPDLSHPNAAVHSLPIITAWTESIQATAAATPEDVFPIFMGGDHSISAGSVSGIAQAPSDKPLFVLWLDAHPDFHLLSTTESGNLHGTPVAYFTGQPGFENYFPPLPRAVDPTRVCMIGLRSVDGPERAGLRAAGVTTHDMRRVDETGMAALLSPFLARVNEAGGRLHVSLDVDFLDPAIAPAVGTTVPGGATFREAHLIMEMLHDSGLVTSLDLVELNPFLDERGKTANLLVDLVASLMGRTVLDRPTRSHK